MNESRDHINKAANQHIEEVNNDAIWAGIQQKMKKSERKRRFLPFWIWGGAFFFISLFALGLFLKFDKMTSDNDLSEQITTIDTKANTTSTPISQPLPTTLPKPSSIQKPNSETTSEESEPDVSRLISEIESFSKSKERYESNDLKVVSESQRLKDRTDLNMTSVQNKNQDKSISKSADKKLLKNRDILKIAGLSSELNLFSRRPKLEFPFGVTIPPIAEDRDNSKISFLSSMTFYSQYLLGSKTITGNSEYDLLKNESEELLEQLRFGLESDILNFLDFTFYGGIAYASFNYQVNTTESYFEDRELTYLKSVTVLPDGTEMENYATEELPHHVDKLSKRYNSHRLISVPLGLRFGRDISKFHLGIGFGLDINYYLSNAHTIMNQSEQLSDITIESKWMKPSLHSAIIMDYSIAKNWKLHSKLLYRNTTLNYKVFENEISERYRLFGVDLGLKRLF